MNNIDVIFCSSDNLTEKRSMNAMFSYNLNQSHPQSKVMKWNLVFFYILIARQGSDRDAYVVILLVNINR